MGCKSPSPVVLLPASLRLRLAALSTAALLLSLAGCSSKGDPDDDAGSSSPEPPMPPSPDEVPAQPRLTPAPRTTLYFAADGALSWTAPTDGSIPFGIP